MAMTWARPLQRQLLLAILLLLAPILAAGVWLGVVEYRETVEELTELTELTARRTASAVERELTGLDFESLPKDRQRLIALEIVRRETGIMAVSALVVFGLALRAAGTSGHLF